MEAQHRKIPILMYHEIIPQDSIKQLKRTTKSKYIVTAEKFRQQMSWLASESYSTISLDDVVDFLQGKTKRTLSSKSVVITFDDGYVGNYKYALPILKEYGLTAVFFVVVDRIGSPRMLDWSQLEALNAAGMSIQSHSMTHPFLAQLSYEDITYELQESKRILQEKLHTNIDYISLPNGSYNELYQDIAKEVGYRGGCISAIGYVDSSCDPHFLTRIVVDGNFKMEQFKSIATCDERIIKKIMVDNRLKDVVRIVIGEKIYYTIYKILYGSQR